MLGFKSLFLVLHTNSITGLVTNLLLYTTVFQKLGTVDLF